jgi:TonB family protein
MLTHGSARLRDVAYIAAHQYYSVAVFFFVLFLLILGKIISLPLDFYGFRLEHRYHLSNQKLGAWLWDELKGWLVGLVLITILVEVLYATIRAFPEHWWLIAWAVFIGFTILLAQLAPVVLFPIFYHFEPLKNEALRERLVRLGERAGTRVRGVYEWKISEKSKKANAALTGLGKTRRIIIADTLLNNYTDDEIEAVLAHELAHVARRDYGKNLGYRLWLLPIAWHPCSWWVLARVVESREMVCDQEAAATLTGRHAYARSLLRLAALYAEGCGPAKSSFAPGILDPGDHALERRIAMLQHPPNPLGSLSRWLLSVACSLVTATVCVSAVAMRADAGQPQAAATSSQPLTIPARELQTLKIAGDNPVYPPEAKKEKIQGWVVLEAWIGADGRVGELRVVKSPTSLLSESAKTAVRTWRYRPYLVNGKPVPIRTTVHVGYFLEH